MNPSSSDMPREYSALAEERANAKCLPHRQVEEFGYDFRDWVSPYTKGAHKLGGIALVLQDWASVDRLAGEPDPDVQLHGRTRTLRTNVRLEALLNRVLGLTLPETYATNAFPFIKAGGMSAQLPLTEVVRGVRQFTVRELKIAEPTAVLALGALPYAALRKVGIDCVRLPHPAARIGALGNHEAAWRSALSAAGVAISKRCGAPRCAA